MDIVMPVKQVINTLNPPAKEYIKQILNPYVAAQSKYGKKDCQVLYRYLIAGQIRWKVIATCDDMRDANRIARALNRDSENK